MKYILMAALVASTMLSSAAQANETYQLDPNHTNVVWHANHFGFSNPSGRFGIVDGTVQLDAAAPAKSAVNVTIDVAGLSTGIDKFTTHLKSADFLDAEKFPQATFKSTKVDVTGKDTAKVHGDLTLHGVTKPVVLDVTLNKLAPSPMSQIKTAGFSAKTTIKRSEFGISQYVPGVSDDVVLSIEAEANLKDEAVQK